MVSRFLIVFSLIAGLLSCDNSSNSLLNRQYNFNGFKMEPLYHKNDGLNGVLYLVRDGALVDSLIGVSNYGRLIFSELNTYVLMEVPERGGVVLKEIGRIFWILLVVK